jgi:ribonuclease HI
VVKEKKPGTMPTVIFADGASSGNPGPGGWGAVVATPNGMVRELGGGVRETTNNKMELTAVIRALEDVRTVPGDLAIYTDSVYVIRGITQWIWGWRKRDWKTAEGGDVANVDLWKALSAQVAARKLLGEITWGFVRGHSGIPGNERVDQIAVAFSKGSRPSLYIGPLLRYSVAIHDIPEDTELPPMREREGPKPAALCYLSLVNGVLMRHSTWPECEARVKGRPGAKFKKAMTAEDEARILREWGVKK